MDRQCVQRLLIIFNVTRNNRYIRIRLFVIFVESIRKTDENLITIGVIVARCEITITCFIIEFNASGI